MSIEALLVGVGLVSAYPLQNFNSQPVRPPNPLQGLYRSTFHWKDDGSHEYLWIDHLRGFYPQPAYRVVRVNVDRGSATARYFIGNHFTITCTPNSITEFDNTTFRETSLTVSERVLTEEYNFLPTCGNQCCSDQNCFQLTNHYKKIRRWDVYSAVAPWVERATEDQNYPYTKDNFQMLRENQSEDEEG